MCFWRSGFKQNSKVLASKNWLAEDTKAAKPSAIYFRGKDYFGGMVSIDALRLDHELLLLFQGHIDRCFRPLDQDSAEAFKPETDALLSLALWYGCVWRQRPTPGQALLGLRYYNGTPGAPPGALPAASQRAALGVCWVLLPWLVERLRRVGLSRGWPSYPEESRERQIWTLLVRAEACWKYLYLLNLVAYLAGRRHYPSVAEGVAGVHLTAVRRAEGPRAEDTGSPTEEAFRSISFQFMNRELLWEALTR